MSLDDITLAVDYFDLKKIAESGQCFRWKELGPGKYLIPSSQTCAIMEQKEPDDDLHLLIEEGTLPLWQDYLNYGERYGSIVREAREATLEPELRAACTTCALKAGVTTGGKH